MLRVIRIQDVCDKIALSRTSLWRLCKTTDFPRPIQLGGRVACFSEVLREGWESASTRSALRMREVPLRPC